MGDVQTQQGLSVDTATTKDAAATTTTTATDSCCCNNRQLLLQQQTAAVTSVIARKPVARSTPEQQCSASSRLGDNVRVLGHGQPTNDGRDGRRVALVAVETEERDAVRDVRDDSACQGNKRAESRAVSTTDKCVCLAHVAARVTHSPGRPQAE